MSGARVPAPSARSPTEPHGGGADTIFVKGKISSLEKNQPPTSKTCHRSKHGVRQLVDTGLRPSPGDHPWEGVPEE